MATKKTGCQQTEAELVALEAEAKAKGVKLCVRVTDGSDNDDPKKWAINALRFDDVEKAKEYALDLYCRWSGMRAWFFDLAPEADLKS